MGQVVKSQSNSQGYATVENWLSRLAPSSHKVQRYIVGRFIKWLGKKGGKFADFTPDRLIEYQAGATGNGEKFEILDVIQRYVIGMEGRAGYKTKTYSALRSFFAHNRAELPRDRSFKIRSEKERVIGTLTVEEAKKMIDGSNPTYKAIFLSMLQGGMGIGEFEYWNFHGFEELEEQLSEKKVQVIKVSLPGRKAMRNVRPYYTYIGGDSIEAIRNYLSKRKEGDPPGAIFYNKDGDPVTRDAVKLYWHRHLHEGGLIERKRNGKRSNRYGKNTHELRTLFRSQWDKTPASGTVAEYCMGHEIDPYDYNQSFRDEDWTRGEYMKALPMLQLMSSGKPFGMIKADEDDIQKLRNKVDTLEAERETMITREQHGELLNFIEKLQKQLDDLTKKVDEKTKG